MIQSTAYTVVLKECSFHKYYKQDTFREIFIIELQIGRWEFTKITSLKDMYGIPIALLIQEKWRGVLHHVCNQHEWYQGECEHDALTEPPTNNNGIEISYFVRGDSDFRLLQKILTNKKWMTSLKYFTRFRYVVMLLLMYVLLFW